MKTTFGKVISELRKSQSMSVKELAKKLKITQVELEEYEENKAEPTLSILEKLGNIFSVSLDWFDRTNKYNPSDYRDLIITSKNNKKAIYDTRQGKLNTPYIYDAIYMSVCGYHTVKKLNQYQLENGDTEVEILYSGIVNNSGKLIKFREDAIIGFNFDMFGTAIASKSLVEGSKKYLVDVNGKTLSKEYGYIRTRPPFEDKNYKRYYMAYETFEEINSEDAHPTYLDSNGNEINTAFNSIEDVCKSIEKSGAVVLDLIPNKFFKESDNYLSMVSALDEYIINNTQKDKYLYEFEKRYIVDDIIDGLLFLIDKANMLNPISWTTYTFKRKDRDYIDNRIMQNYVAKNEMMLIEILNGKRN